MIRLDALVGFSVNLEETLEITEGWEERKSLVKASPLIVAGTSYNVALAMKNAGAQVKMLGTVGDDDLAGALERLVTRTGLDTHYLPIREATPKTTSLILPTGEPRQKLLRAKPSYRNYGREEINKELMKQVRLADPHYCVMTAVRIQDLPLVEMLLEIIGSEAPSCFKVLAPDTSFLSRQKELHAVADFCQMIAMNNFEAEKLVGFPIEDDPSRLLEYAPECLLTCNSHGAYYISNETIIRQPAFETEVIIDETGAGDCFLGYFLALRDTLGVPKALELAAASSALKIMRLGGSNLPVLKEVKKFLREKPIPI